MARIRARRSRSRSRIRRIRTRTKAKTKIRARTKPRQPRREARPRRHDRSRRNIFSHLRTIKDLIKGFIPGDWTQDLDLSTLKKLSTDYVTYGLGERIGDVVWEVQWRGKPLYLCLVIEFQSAKIPFMALRMLVYVALFYLRLVKERGLGKGDRLPPVYPLMFYNGPGEYDVAVEISDLIAGVPPGLSPFQPSMSHLVIEELSQPVDDFEQVDNVVGKFLRLQQSDPEQMRDIVHEELDWIDEESPELMADLLEWMELALLPLRQPETPVPELKTLDELKNYMETDMESWSDMLQARGRAEGEARGEAKGEANVILFLIEQKFGALSEAIRTRVRSADSEHLLQWAERILTAKRLDEVFGDAR